MTDAPVRKSVRLNIQMILYQTLFSFSFVKMFSALRKASPAGRIQPSKFMMMRKDYFASAVNATGIALEVASAPVRYSTLNKHSMWRHPLQAKGAFRRIGHPSSLRTNWLRCSFQWRFTSYDTMVGTLSIRPAMALKLTPWSRQA